MKLGFIFGTILLLIAGFMNLEFLGGPSVPGMENILLSAATYITWIILLVMLVKRSGNPVSTCGKISLVLLVCMAAGFLLGHSPIGIFFICPLMGIAAALQINGDWNITIVLMYAGLILLIWLGCLLVKGRNSHKTT